MAPGGLMEQLMVLRRHLLRWALGLGLLFLCLVPFANALYEWLSAPLRRQLPQGSQMIATEVVTPVLTPIALCAWLALLISLPLLIYQLLRFAMPGLYADERRLALALSASAVMLFYGGAMVARYAVLPMVFALVLTMGPDSIIPMTDIASYLRFTLRLALGFGLAFELPVVILLMVRAGLVRVATLRRHRPVVVVACFVMGMFMTPPDVLSQTMLALPVWALFEIGLLIAARLERR